MKTFLPYLRWLGSEFVSTFHIFLNKPERQSILSIIVHKPFSILHIGICLVCLMHAYQSCKYTYTVIKHTTVKAQTRADLRCRKKGMSNSVKLVTLHGEEDISQDYLRWHHVKFSISSSSEKNWRLQLDVSISMLWSSSGECRTLGDAAA